MDATCYIRVSSKAQSYDTQWHAIEQAASARGDSIPAPQVYREKQSAKTMLRPELERLRSDVRAGRIKRLYVYRLDRLSRTGIRDTFDLLGELKNHSCEIVSCADGFDFSGPMSDVIIAVMAWAAQMERLTINERIAGARARMESEGKPWGRPSKVDFSDRHKIATLHSEGRSIREIAMSVGLKKGTVQRALEKLRAAADRKDGESEGPKEGESDAFQGPADR